MPGRGGLVSAYQLPAVLSWEGDLASSQLLLPSYRRKEDKSNQPRAVMTKSSYICDLS